MLQDAAENKLIILYARLYNEASDQQWPLRFVRDPVIHCMHL